MYVCKGIVPCEYRKKGTAELLKKPAYWRITEVTIQHDMAQPPESYENTEKQAKKVGLTQ